MSVEGRVIEVRVEHVKKQLAPIDSTPSGIAIDESLVELNA